MRDFKNLKLKTYETVKIRGMYEWRMKPVELIFNVSFSLIPKNPQQNSFDFQKELKKQLSLFAIDRHCKALSNKEWKFDGSRYTYDHDILSIKPDLDKCSLGLDLYFIQQDANSNIKDFYEQTCEQISRFPIFKSSELVDIRPHRK